MSWNSIQDYLLFFILLDGYAYFFNQTLSDLQEFCPRKLTETEGSFIVVASTELITIEEE